MMIEALSPGQLEQIDSTARRLLSDVGVVCLSKEGRRIYKEAGAVVDEETKNVKVPAELVDYARKNASGKFVLWNRTGTEKMDLMDGNIRGHNVGGCIHILDREKKLIRDATKEDLERMTVLIDALENIQVARPVVYPAEFPVHQRDMYTAATMLEFTIKPYGVSAYSPRNQEVIMEIASVVAGGRDKLIKKPFIWGSVSPISPLKYSESTTDILIGWAKSGLPVAVCSAPVTGGSGPVTLAGSLALSHAEFLFGFVLTQIIRPGADVKCTNRLIPMDMRNGLSNFGAVEMGMMSAGTAQLSKYYNVASDVYGVCTATRFLDEEAGYEKALNGLIPALAGANLIASAGMLENALTSSPEQLVIDNDILGMIFRAYRGIKVDEEALAFDVVKELALDGNFLAHEHTLDNMREEMYLSKLSFKPVNSGYDTEYNIVESASDTVKKIIAEHKPIELDADKKTKVYQLLTEAVAESIE